MLSWKVLELTMPTDLPADRRFTVNRFGAAKSGFDKHPNWVMPWLILVGLVLAAAPASASPIVWGTDEDTGNLVKIEDYDTSPQVTDYGRLSIDDGGTARPFPDTDTEHDDVFSDIESFTLNDQGYAYMVGNSPVDFSGGGSFASPHLYRIRIFESDGTVAVTEDDATASGGYNALESVAAISGISSGAVNGLDFDPISGDLFAVVENGGRDDLVTINQFTGVTTMIHASMDGTDDVEDIQFDEFGNLYLLDDDGGANGSDDVLMRVTLDRSGLIPSLLSISVVNNTGDDHRIESIAWDFMNQRLIGFSDESNTLFELNTDSDGYTVLGPVGFNDIEGIDFVPTPTGLPVPEPTTALLLSIGLAGLVGSRRWQRTPTT